MRSRSCHSLQTAVACASSCLEGALGGDHPRLLCRVPCPPHSPNSSQSALQGSGGGTSQKRMVGQWPALKGRKISQTVFTLDPCAMRPAHVHQRADGLLYVISGKLLRHWPPAQQKTVRSCSPWDRAPIPCAPAMRRPALPHFRSLHHHPSRTYLVQGHDRGVHAAVSAFGSSCKCMQKYEEDFRQSLAAALTPACLRHAFA